MHIRYLQPMTDARCMVFGPGRRSGLERNSVLPLGKYNKMQRLLKKKIKFIFKFSHLKDKLVF